jgi:hypothetical protein
MELLRNKYIKLFLYPTITVLLFIVVGILFWRMAIFLSTSVRSTFFSQNQFAGQLIVINLPNLELVAKKLSVTLPETASTPIEIISPLDLIATSTPTSTPVTPSTTPVTIIEEVATTTISIENKKDLTIEILNSTATRGLAGVLKTTLENAGFVVITTGNQATIEPLTLIKVKASKNTYTTSLQELTTLVSKKYSPQQEMLDETSAVDIQIVIGTK